MKFEAAIIADRDDAAGALAVLLRIDREALDDLVDFRAAFFEPGAFSRQLFVPFDLQHGVELSATRVDLLDLGGEIGRNLGRLWRDAGVLGEKAVFGIKHRLGPGPLRTQFFRLGFEFLDRETAHQCGIVEEAVVIAAEEIARDLAAGGLVGFGDRRTGRDRNRAAPRSRSAAASPCKPGCRNCP